MMQNLSSIYQSDDILSIVFSFLPLESIALIELANKRFYHLLREDFTDKIIYKEAIIRLFSHHDDASSENVKHELNEFLKENNCRELLKEFYMIPFIQDDEFVNNSDYMSYFDKGGVINFGLYIPCKLLRILLKLYRNHLHIKNTLHKFLLFSLISEWKFNVNVKFQIGIVHEEIPFYEVYCDYKRYPSSTFPFKQYLIGKGLILMFNQFNEIQNDSSSSRTLALSTSSNQDLVVFYRDLIKNAEPIEGWVDVFQLASEPPYGLESCDEEVKELTKFLYNDHDGSCEHYCWNEFIGEEQGGIWAAFWIGGLEWWGTYSLTTYDYSKERFVIAAASTTD